MKIDGACHCGYITIEGEAESGEIHDLPLHGLSDRQGFAFRVSVPVSGATFRMSGQATTYLKTTADSGNPRVQAFCPRCGSPIYSTRPATGRSHPTRSRRHLAPAQGVHAKAAKLVPFGTALVTGLARSIRTRSRPERPPPTPRRIRPCGWFAPRAGDIVRSRGLFVTTR